MCTGAEIGLILVAVGGLTEAQGQKQEGEAAAALAAYNARVRRMQARDAVVRGEEDVRAIRRIVAQMIGSQRAGYAGQGVLLDTGTPLEIQADTAALGEEDVIRRRNNALREAWGFRAGANILDFQGTAAKQAGNQAALGTLLGTAGNAYSMSNP